MLPIEVKRCVLSRIAELYTKVEDLKEIAMHGEFVDGEVIEYYQRESIVLTEFLEKNGDLF